MITIIFGVVGTISAALISLALWRYQLIGKRRYEITEQIMQTATKAVEAFQFIRSAGGYGGEGESRQRQPNEDPNDTRHLDALYVTIERLVKNNNVFRDLFNVQVLCDMHFGEQAGRPLKELLDIHHEVYVAAQIRFETREGPSTDEGRKLYATIYSISEPNPINTRINTAFDAIKRLAQTQLRPHWITLLLPFVTPDHIAWCRGRLRHWTTK